MERGRPENVSTEEPEDAGLPVRKVRLETVRRLHRVPPVGGGQSADYPQAVWASAGGEDSQMTGLGPVELPDDKKYICLDCPFPEPCGTRIRLDCPLIGEMGGQKTRRGRPSDRNLDQKVCKLVERGLSDREIGFVLGKSESAIRHRRKRLGICRPVKSDPCLKCGSRKICDERGGICGEKARWSGAPVSVSK